LQAPGSVERLYEEGHGHCRSWRERALGLGLAEQALVKCAMKLGWL